MADYTITSRVPRDVLKQRLRMLPAILAGRRPDVGGIAHGFAMRVAYAWLMLVKLAFLVKARGGVDEAGISWSKLSKKYLAYVRPFGNDEKARLKRDAGLGKANRYAPGGNKGLLTKAELDLWRRIYAHNLARLAANEPIGAAKAHAAAIAWTELKKRGAKTMLEVYGNRTDYEILRDRGILFNSLSPGSEPPASEVDFTLTPNSPDQVIEYRRGEIFIGTNVVYAAAHHAPKNNKRPQRKLWPDENEIPQSWVNEIEQQASQGVVLAIQMIADGRLAA